MLYVEPYHQRVSQGSQRNIVLLGDCGVAQGLLRLQCCVVFILAVAVDSREKSSDVQCKPCLCLIIAMCCGRVVSLYLTTPSTARVDVTNGGLAFRSCDSFLDAGLLRGATQRA